MKAMIESNYAYRKYEKKKRRSLSQLIILFLYYVSSGCFHTYSLTSQIPSMNNYRKQNEFHFLYKVVGRGMNDAAGQT